MGRSIPMECHHGNIIDWGGFGTCEGCDGHPEGECPDLPDCDECEREAER